MVDLCCEQCGLDLTNWDNVDILEAELFGEDGYIQVTLQCQCGMAYAGDLLMDDLEPAYGREHAVIRFAKEDTGAE